MLDLGKAFESQKKDAELLTADRIAGISAQAGEAEFLAKLGTAEGEKQATVNRLIIAGLELREDAARVQFEQTASVEDEKNYGEEGGAKPDDY